MILFGEKTVRNTASWRLGHYLYDRGLDEPFFSVFRVACKCLIYNQLRKTSCRERRIL